MNEKIARRFLTNLPSDTGYYYDTRTSIVVEKLLSVALAMSKLTEGESPEELNLSLSEIKDSDEICENFGERYLPFYMENNTFDKVLMHNAFQSLWGRIDTTDAVSLLPNADEFDDSMYWDYEMAQRFQEALSQLPMATVVGQLLCDFNIGISDIEKFPDVVGLIWDAVCGDSICEPIIDMYAICIKSIEIGSYLRKKDILRLSDEEKAEIDKLIEICSDPLGNYFRSESAVVSTGEWVQITLYGTDGMGQTEIYTSELDPRFPFAAELLKTKLARLDKKFHFIDKLPEGKGENGEQN